MSKTVDSQIEKSACFINAVRKRIPEVQDKGFSNQLLDDMEQQLVKLKDSNMRCDALRAQLAEEVRKTNEILLQVKDVYKEKKNILKGYYPQERWSDYGILDKR
jgi:hypothetical protein